MNMDDKDGWKMNERIDVDTRDEKSDNEKKVSIF